GTGLAPAPTRVWEPVPTRGVRSMIIRLVAASALAMEIAIHADLAPDRLREVPYAGVGFVLAAVLLSLALVGVLGHRRRGCPSGRLATNSTPIPTHSATPSNTARLSGGLGQRRRPRAGRAAGRGGVHRLPDHRHPAIGKRVCIATWARCRPLASSRGTVSLGCW